MLFCRLRLPSGSTFAQSELQLSTSTIPPPPLDYQLLPPHPAPTPRTSSCTFSIQYQPWVAPQARTPAQHIPYRHTRQLQHANLRPKTPTTTTATTGTKETCAIGPPATTDAVNKPVHHCSPAQQFCFPIASRSTSTPTWQELAHKPTHQSSSHMIKRAMLVT